MKESKEKKGGNISNKDNGGKDNKSKKTFIILIVLLTVVIVSLAAVIIYLVTRKQPEPQVAAPTVITADVIDENNVSEIMEDLNTPAEDASYEVNMTPVWVFKNGTSVSENAMVRNSEANSRTVYFQVMLSETYELIYTSPYIAVGGTLEDIKLDRDLDAGEYDAIIKYILVDDDFNDLTDVSVTVDIVVSE